MILINTPFIYLYFASFDHYIYLIFLADQKSYADFIEKHSIPVEEATTWQYSMLQKSAKSTCIVKNTYLLGKVMEAKKKECINLYFSKFYVSTFMLTKV